MVCQRKVDAEVIREDIFNQTIPKCGACPQPEQSQHQETESAAASEHDDDAAVRTSHEHTSSPPAAQLPGNTL